MQWPMTSRLTLTPPSDPCKSRASVLMHETWAVLQTAGSFACPYPLCWLQRVLEVSAQLQQSQADLMGSQRHTAQLSDQLAATKAKLQSSENIKNQLTEAGNLWNLSDVTQSLLRNACVCQAYYLHSVACKHIQASCASLHRSQQDLCWF